MLLFKKSALAIFASTLALTAHSEELSPDVAFGISTFGATITPRFELSNTLAVRVPVSYAISENAQDNFEMLTSIFTLNVIDSSDIQMIGGGGIIFDRATKKKNVNYSAGILAPIYKVRDQTEDVSHFGLGPYTGLNYTYGNTNGISLSLDAGAMYDMKSDEISEYQDSIFDKALSLTGISARTIPYFSASFQYSF